MNPRIVALREQRNNLIAEGDRIRSLYTGHDVMSAEDAERFDKIYADADALEKQIEREQTAEKIKVTNEVVVTGLPQPGEGVTVDSKAKDARAKAWKNYLRQGERTAPADLATLRAYQVDSDTEMGYLVVPEEMVFQLLQNVVDMVFLRSLAHTIQIPRAESLGVPTLDARMNDTDWTSELATGTEDTAIRIGKRTLHPHPLAKQVKLSNRLIRMAAIDPESLIRMELARTFAQTEEKAFLTGDGDQKPLGIFTVGGAAGGISTARDVVTGSTTDVTADGLINAAYFLKPQYWANARWMMHRDVLRNIRKLKDGEGDYIWQSGLASKTAPTILDFPYTVSEFCPNTFTTGKYVAVLADYSFYWIADALDMQIQVLNELFALTNQVGYIARKETDAMPVLEEAFVRVVLS